MGILCGLVFGIYLGLFVLTTIPCLLLGMLAGGVTHVLGKHDGPSAF